MSDAPVEEASGAGFGVRILSRMLETGRFDLGATLELATDPSMLLGAAGGVLGYQVAARVAGAFLPPGAGVFLQMLPRFLGGALGFELARGRIDHIDVPALMTQALVSAGGYSLVHLVLGATAPGWALMAGATVFGLFANLLTRRKPVEAAPRESMALPALAGHEPASASVEAGPAAPTAADRGRREAYRHLVAGLEAGAADLEARWEGYRAAAGGP